MKAIRVDNTGSVCIDTGCGFNVWVDVWRDDDGELMFEWNKYIFMNKDANDMRIKAFQEDNFNFIKAMTIAEDAYLEWEGLRESKIPFWYKLNKLLNKILNRIDYE